MASPRQYYIQFSGISLPAATATLPHQQAQPRRWLRTAIALAIVFALAVVTPLAQAQNFQVIHTFTGGGDGAIPFGSLILDPAGNLYGATAAGGNDNCSTFLYTGCGAIVRLHRQGSGWILAALYAFGQDDGQVPAGPLLRDASGILYGVTGAGGDDFGLGTILQLRPSPTGPAASVNASWNETILYAFAGGNDGAYPSPLTADPAGNLYGVTGQGGTGSGGTVFKLTPSGDGWTETVIHSFTFGGAGGSSPTYGVVLDMAGNLYGTTSGGGLYGCGVVYELTPSGMETVIYTFTSGNDGCAPYARVIFDQSGNLFGATSSGGAGGGGVAFELSPGTDGWTYKVLYSFSGSPFQNDGPQQSLVMDAAGNLYGATFGEGLYGAGAAFQLTLSNGSWDYTSLHDFTGGNDGGLPAGAVVLDSNNNVYGMTSYGGTSNKGVAYEIGP